MTAQPNGADGSQSAPQPGRQLLVSVEKLAAWMTANRGKILRYAWIPQVFAGLIFLGLAYLLGYTHFQLIREGVRAPGRIVAYKQQSFHRSSGSSSTSFMPIVEFHTNGRFVQFQDWMGSNSPGALYNPVIVLYDPANPTVAMIDRPVWNWLPWAPVLGVGLFLVLVAVKGALRSLS